MSSQLAFVVARFRDLQAANLAQDFGSACDAFVDAVTAAPDIGFRYFMTRASAPVANALRETGRASEVVATLDGLLTEHPNMHLLVDYDPDLIHTFTALRDSNIRKGLPSIILVTQAKSASISVGNIFHLGFNLPSFVYSLANIEVIQNWVCDYARGGACYVTHLDPSERNTDRIRRAGIDRVIVHVRDPRQSLLSMIHHVSRYQDDLPQLSKNGFNTGSMSAQIAELMNSYISWIQWIQGWMDAENRLTVLFSTFEDFVRDRAAFIKRYVEFYGVSGEHFSFESATRTYEEVDHHFRTGLIDEWREVFPPRETELLSASIPAAMKQQFGWTD